MPATPKFPRFPDWIIDPVEVVARDNRAVFRATVAPDHRPDSFSTEESGEGTAGDDVTDDGASQVTGEVIVKCLLPPFTDTEEELFKNEFLALEAMHHPNWVRPGRFFYLGSQTRPVPVPADSVSTQPGPERSGDRVDGAGQDASDEKAVALKRQKAGANGFGFTLELSKGRSFDEFPVRGWTPETFEVARQILSGLHALHLMGLAQLDLKPEQLLITWSGTNATTWDDWSRTRSADPNNTESEDDGGIRDNIRVHMFDLGLAHKFGESIPATGTPGYMAPEISQRDFRTIAPGTGAVVTERRDRETSAVEQSLARTTDHVV